MPGRAGQPNSTVAAKKSDATIQQALFDGEAGLIDFENLPRNNGKTIIEHEGKAILEITQHDGAYELRSSFKYDFCFSGSFECKKMRLNIPGNVNFLGNLSAKNTLYISASSIMAEGDLSAEQGIKLKADYVSTRGSLDANTVILESDDTISLKHKTTAHKRLKIRAPIVKNSGKIDTSEGCHATIQAESGFFTQPESACVFKGPLHMSGNYIQLKGRLIAEDSCAVQAERLDAGNEVTLGNLTDLNADLCYVHPGAKLNWNPNSSPDVKISKLLHVIKGGEASLHGKHILCDEVRSEGKVTIKDSNMVANQITALGQIDLIRSRVETDAWYTQGEDNFENAVLIAKTEALIFDGNKRLKESRIQSPYLNMTGNVTLDSTKMESERCVLRPASLNMKAANINADDLSIYRRGAGQERFLGSHDTTLNTSHLTLDADLTLKDSAIVANAYEDGKKSSQGIFGHLKLQNSSFYSKDGTQIYAHDSATIDAVNSKVNAPQFFSWANIALNSAKLEVDHHYQSKNKMDVKDSTIKTHGFFLDSSEMDLEETVFQTDAFLSDGNTVAKNSELKVKNDLMLGDDASMRAQKSTVNASKVNLLGKMRHDDSQMEVENNFHLGEQAELEAAKSTIKTGNVTSYGRISLNNNATLSGRENVFLATTSRTTMNDSKIKGQNIEVHGGLDLVGAGGKLEAVHSIQTGSTAKVRGEALVIDSNRWSHSGKMNVEKLSATGKQFLNLTGNVQATQAKFGYDHVWLNLLGKVSAGQLTLHSNMLNIGGISAKQMQISGFVNANAGLISTHDYCESSLLSFNTGGVKATNLNRSALYSLNTGLELATPSLTTDPSELFSWKNVSRYINTAADIFIPGAASLVRLGTHAATAVMQMPSTKNSLNNIGDKIKHIKDMRAHEVMPLLNQAKDLGMSAVHNASVLGAAVDNLQDFSLGNFSEDVVAEGLWQVGNVFGGSINNDSLFSDNRGVTLGKSVAVHGYAANNSGLTYGVDSTVISADHVSNTGKLGAGRNGVITGKTVENAGSITGHKRMRIYARDHLHNKKDGKITSKSQTQIKTKQFTQAGEATLHSGVVDVDVLNLGSGSQTDVKRVKISTDDLSMESDHTLALEDAQIEASTIKRADGHLNISGGAQVNTESYNSSKGSKITVQKLPDSESDTSSELMEDGVSSDNTGGEIAPPKNILLLNSKTAELADEIDGGDAAFLNIDDVKYRDGTNLKGNVYGKGSSASVDKNATAKFSGGHQEYGNYQFDGNVDANNQVFQGEKTQVAGNASFDNALLDMKESVKFDETADISMSDTHVRSEDINDASNMELRGENLFNASEGKYTHTGRMTAVKVGDGDSTLHVYSKKGNLEGKAELDHVIINIESMQGGASDFAAGVGLYAGYNVSGFLAFETGEELELNQGVRNCDQHLAGSKVKVTSDIKTDHYLGLSSTKGSIDIVKDVDAQNITLDSAAEINLNSKLRAEEDNVMQAKDAIKVNRGRVEAGGNVKMRGSEIKTYGKDHKNKSSRKNRKKTDDTPQDAMPMGKEDGAIVANNETLLESTRGNIEINGAKVAGGEYCQLVSAADVLLRTTGTAKLVNNNIERNYTPAVVQGGRGSQTNGIGAYIYANNKVIIDASLVASLGSNYIEGEQGIDFRVRERQLPTETKTKKTWYGTKEETKQTNTDVLGSVVSSQDGKNIYYSSSGHIRGEAATHLSKDGTHVNADNGDIDFKSRITTDKKEEETEHLFGLIRKRNTAQHQKSTPTVFIDNGLTRIAAPRGNVNMEGVNVLGDGDLEIYGKNVVLRRDKLEHHIREKEQSIGFSAFGAAAVDAWQNGGGLWEVLAATDPTMAKLDGLVSSDNFLEYLAHGSALGFNLLNTTSSLAHGVGEGSLAGELLQRYGLGDESGFNPSVNVTLDKSDKQYSMQTPGNGHIRRNNVKIYAEEDLGILDGQQVEAQGDAKVGAKRMRASAAELESKTDVKKTKYSVGVTTNGNVTNIGAGYDRTKMNQKEHVNAGLHAGGKLTMDVGVLDVKGADISAQSVAGHVDKMNLASTHDTQSIENKHASANTSGLVTAGYSKHQSRKVNESTFYIRDGINSDEEAFTVGEAHLAGASVVSDGVNNFNPGNLTTETLYDETKSSGVSVAANVHDIARAIGIEKPPEDYSRGQSTLSQPVIDTATVGVQLMDQVTAHDATVYGAKGINSNINLEKGQRLNTKTPRHARAVRNKKLGVRFDIPLTDTERLKSVKKTLTHAKNALSPRQQQDKMYIPQPVKPEHDFDLEAIPSINETDLEALPEISPDKVDSGCKMVVKVLKKGVDGASDVIIGIIEKENKQFQLPAKLSVAKATLLYNFALNTFSEGGDMKAGALDTWADFCAAQVIKYSLKACNSAAAVPGVGWGLFAVDMLDDMMPHETVDEMRADMYTHQQGMQAAVQQSDYWTFMYERELAVAQQDAVKNSNIVHYISTGSHMLTDFFKNIFWQQTEVVSDKRSKLKNK